MKHCVLNWQVRNYTYSFTGILLKRFNTIVFLSDDSIPIIDIVYIQQGFETSAMGKNLKFKILAKKMAKNEGSSDVTIIVGKNIKRIDATEEFLEENDGLLGNVPDNLNGTIKTGTESNIYRMPKRVYDEYAQNI